MRPRFVLVCAMVAFTALACGGGDDTGGALEGTPEATVAASPDVTGSLSAADQSGDGKSLTVQSVTIDGAPGFVAVHKDSNGEPGPVVGNAKIAEGTSTNVLVTFDQAQSTGKLWPMLHVDAGQIGTYEFPGPDTPVLGADQKPVMKQITLTVM